MVFWISGSLKCAVIFQINFENEKLFKYFQKIPMFAAQI